MITEAMKLLIDVRSVLDGWCAEYGYKTGDFEIMRDKIDAYFDKRPSVLVEILRKESEKDLVKEEWINVEDELPKIPKGRFGVSILIAEFDPVYEEINPGHGYSISQATYHIISDAERKFWKYPEDVKKDFATIYYGAGKDVDWGPPGDEVTHWMPLPDLPSRGKSLGVKRGRLIEDD